MNLFDTWAICTPELATTLAPFDHHRALIGKRWGILLTAHWLEQDQASEAYQLQVVFTVAPQSPLTDNQRHLAVQQHPSVPPEIQALLDELDFQMEPGKATQ